MIYTRPLVVALMHFGLICIHLMSTWTLVFKPQPVIALGEIALANISIHNFGPTDTKSQWREPGKIPASDVHSVEDTQYIP